MSKISITTSNGIERDAGIGREFRRHHRRARWQRDRERSPRDGKLRRQRRRERLLDVGGDSGGG